MPEDSSSLRLAGSYDELVSPLRFFHWITLFLAAGMGISLILVFSFPKTASVSSSEAMMDMGTTVKDDYAVIAGKALGPELSEADFVILGSSSVRESLWEDAKLGEECRSLGKTACHTIQLVASAQSLTEALFLLDDAPLHSGQQVLLFVSPMTFAYDVKETLFRMQEGFFLREPYPFAKKYRAKIPELKIISRFPQPEITFLRITRTVVYRHFFLGLKDWFSIHFYGQQPRMYERYQYSHVKLGRRVKTALLMRKIRKRFRKGFPAHREYHERVLRVLIERIREKGATPVLMETARLQEASGIDPEEWEKYRSLLKKSTAEYGIAYVDLNSKVRFKPDDFVDGRHTTASGRNKWSPALADWLSKQ